MPTGDPPEKHISIRPACQYQDDAAVTGPQRRSCGEGGSICPHAACSCQPPGAPAGSLTWEAAVHSGWAPACPSPTHVPTLTRGARLHTLHPPSHTALPAGTTPWPALDQRHCEPSGRHGRYLLRPVP